MLQIEMKMKQLLACFEVSTPINVHLDQTISIVVSLTAKEQWENCAILLLLMHLSGVVACSNESAWSIAFNLSPVCYWLPDISSSRINW